MQAIVYSEAHQARLRRHPHHRAHPTIHSGIGARSVRVATPRAQMPGSHATTPMHTPCWSTSLMTTSSQPWNRQTPTATTPVSRAPPTAATRPLSIHRWSLQAARARARSACPAPSPTCTLAPRSQTRGGHACARASHSRARLHRPRHRRRRHNHHHLPLLHRLRHRLRRQ